MLPTMRRSRPQTSLSWTLRAPALLVPVLPDLAPQAPVHLAPGRVQGLGQGLVQDQGRVQGLDPGAMGVIRLRREVVPVRGLVQGPVQDLLVLEIPGPALRADRSPALLDRHCP